MLPEIVVDRPTLLSLLTRGTGDLEKAHPVSIVPALADQMQSAIQEFVRYGERWRKAGHEGDETGRLMERFSRLRRSGAIRVVELDQEERRLAQLLLVRASRLRRAYSVERVQLLAAVSGAKRRLVTMSASLREWAVKILPVLELPEDIRDTLVGDKVALIETLLQTWKPNWIRAPVWIAGTLAAGSALAGGLDALQGMYLRIQDP